MSLKFTVKLGRWNGQVNTCEWCNYTTRSQQLFEKHLNICKPPLADTDGSESKSEDKKLRRHSCDECEFVADRHRSLLLHQAANHGREIFKCDQCEYVSRFKNKLKQHRTLKHSSGSGSSQSSLLHSKPASLYSDFSSSEVPEDDFTFRPKAKRKQKSTGSESSEKIDIENFSDNSNLARSLSSESNLSLIPTASSGKSELKVKRTEKGEKIKAPARKAKVNTARKTCHKISPSKNESQIIPRNEVGEKKSFDYMNKYYESIVVNRTDGDGEVIILEKSQCRLCKFSTKPKSKLFRHLYLRHIPRHLIKKNIEDDKSDALATYQCQLCIYSHDEKKNVGAHFFQFHSESLSCEPNPLLKKHKLAEAAAKQKLLESRKRKKFSCDECLFQTDHPGSFQRHSIHHKVDGPYNCLYCNYSSYHQPAIQRHVNTGCHLVPTPTTKDGTSEKQKSGRSTPKESTENNVRKDADIGIKLPSSNKNSYCHLCDLRFETRKELSAHCAELHVGERAWQCAQCHATYLTYEALRRHERSKHEKRKAPAMSNISSILKKKAILKTVHISSVKTKILNKLKKDAFSCFQCAYRTGSSRKLYFHIFGTHPTIENKRKLENVVSEVGKNQTCFPCPLCNNPIKSAFHLKQHLIAHAKGRTKLLDTSRDKNEGGDEAEKPDKVEKVSLPPKKKKVPTATLR